MRWAIGAIVVALIIAGGVWFYRFTQIDICLDRGGRWDYETSVCER